MSYIKKEEETGQVGINQQLGQPQGQMTEIPEVSGQSAAPPTSAPTQPQSAQPQQESRPSQRASSGSFTNLQSYVEQNRPAAQNIARQVTRGVENRASQIGQQLAKQQGDFLSRVAENRARLAQAGDLASQQIQQAGQAPQGADVSQTQQLIRGQFNAPVAQLDTQGLQQQARDLASNTQSAQTQQGRQQLLRDTFGGQDYTRGQGALDELILAGSREAREQIAQAPRQATEALQAQIGDARQQALSSLAGYDTQREQLTQRLAGEVDTAQQALQDAIQGNVTGVTDALSGGEISLPQRAALEQAGIVLPERYGQLQTYGVDVLGALGDATSSLASPEQLARAQALAELEGTTQDIINNPDLIGQRVPQETLDLIAEKGAAYERDIEAQRGAIDNYLNYIINPPPGAAYGGVPLASLPIEERAKAISTNVGVRDLLSPAISALSNQYNIRDQYGVRGYQPGAVEGVGLPVEDLIRASFGATSGQLRDYYLPQGIDFLPERQDSGVIYQDGGVKKGSKYEALRRLYR